MEFNRRDFLKIAAVGALATTTGGVFYLDDEPMERPKSRILIKGQQYVLGDFHSHIGKDFAIKNPGKVAEFFSTGLTGMTEGKGESISYADALEICKTCKMPFTEIEGGLLAKVENKEDIGYILKAQEVYSSHHVLSIMSRVAIDPSLEPREVIDKIREYGGLSVLAHPYLIDPQRKRLPRIALGSEEKEIVELAKRTDEIEVFNSHCINFGPSSMLPTDMKFVQLSWLKRVNKKAEKLAELVGKRGIASSDAHEYPEQSRMSGIYVPERDISAHSIKRAIKSGDFFRAENYISRLSFLKSRLHEIVSYDTR